MKLVDLASSRASRAQAACAVCSAHHASIITCERHQAHLARRCSLCGGVLRDDERRPSLNDTHFDTDELRPRGKRDASPILATRIRDMSRAAHDYLHAYVTALELLLLPYVGASAAYSYPTPSHVCLVCQREFSSLPLGSTKPFTWTISLVIDRGYPKLCVSNIRDQCHVAVPALSASRAKMSTRSGASISACCV